MVRIGVISDTHGRLPGLTLRLFRGVDRILHAGDIGDPAILAHLRRIAPVAAVRGNMDHGALSALPWIVHEEVAGRLVVLLHGHRVGTHPVRDPGELPALFPEADLIVHGHTHEAAWHRVDGTWVLNPGSAGPGGGPGHPPSVAILEVGADGLDARHETLGPRGRSVTGPQP